MIPVVYDKDACDKFLSGAWSNLIWTATVTVLILVLLLLNVSTASAASLSVNGVALFISAFIVVTRILVIQDFNKKMTESG